jgi:hypothetical protein
MEGEKPPTRGLRDELDNKRRQFSICSSMDGWLPESEQITEDSIMY